MKVLHGMSEVAGQGIYSVKGLQEIGVDAHMAVWRRNSSGYGAEYDLRIGKKKIAYPFYALKMFVFAIKAIKKYDCFHFHYGYSLLPFNLDLPFLKKLNKKIFFEFHGSEIRGVNNDIKYKYFHEMQKNKKQARLLNKMAKYADGFILHDEELKPHLPKSNVPVYIVPLRVDLKKFDPEYPLESKKKPIVIHAPSDRNTKGTDWIMIAVNKLKDKCNFVLVENMTQKEAIEIYKKADVIVDQICIGTYGVFAIEAMALGKPVITYIDDNMRKTFPKTLPIVSADPVNLVNILEKLIDDSDLRYKLGVEGRKYVEEYHDYKKNAVLLKNIYEGK